MDGLVRVLQEQGVGLDGPMISGEDWCCGAITATA
jgi:hypothetical protein